MPETQNSPPVADGFNLAPSLRGPSLAHIADRILNRPLLIHPMKAELILHVLEGRLPLEGADLGPLSPEASRFAGAMSASRTFKIDGGVAIVSVVGSLVNRGAWIGAYSGATSYEGLAKQMGDAAADPAVKSIVLDLDSPGGEATGMFTLAAKVAEVAKEKRVVAVVNDMACSAAYGIASQATEIVVSPTSVVGSIGVVLTHLDRSGELQSKGIKPTLIFAGSHKVDGHPFGPLSDAVRADLQAEVAKFYDQFVSLVAQGRGDRLTEQHARATEARVFIGQEAIDRGLADRMASFDAVLASLQGKPARPSGTSSKGNKAMSGENHITQEAHDAAVKTARAEGETAGRKAGATEATARIAAILGCDAAKDKPKLALSVALETDMSAEAAAKVLASGAPETPVATGLKTIAERAAGMTEAGGQPPVPGAQEKIAADWSKAIKAANASIGVRS